MLTGPEKIAFAVLAALSLGYAALAVRRLARVIGRGKGRLASPWPRLGTAVEKTVSLRTVFRTRPWPGLAHAFVAWCFLFYLVVNLGDVHEGLIEGFRYGGDRAAGKAYRLAADLLSVAALLGIAALLLRRFVLTPRVFSVSQRVTVHPRARRGIRRDSAIVGGFILLHVGGRFAGESLEIAREGRDAWRPLASGASWLWSGLGEGQIRAGEHIAWWLALGLILLFIPYFQRSKHIHLFFAPLGFAVRPRRPALATPEPLSLDRRPAGALRLEELGRASLLDAYTCIQCNRCQDVCPAYAAGTALSPAALEINKRYALNEEAAVLARGGGSRLPLTEFALPPDAAWACTTCAACVQVCPVGNEPVLDILEVRRGLTLNEGALPARGASALMNTTIAGNPRGEAPSTRAAWAEGLGVRTMREAGTVDVLYWVGCSAAYDARNQSIARAVARLLVRAGVDFAILGDEERCSGDPARRMGDEALFQQLAAENMATLGRYGFRRILTHCPHCLNVLRHEYPPLIRAAGQAALARRWEVIHHSTLLAGLVREGRLQPSRAVTAVVAFHDSCYLGRYNGEYDSPRALLAALPGAELREMPRRRERSFCCGGGGGAAWIDVPAERRIADIRMEEALSLGPEVVASACPFCLSMFEGSTTARRADLQLRDVAELLDAATGGG